MADEFGHPLVRHADEHLDRSLDRVERALAPLYEGDRELTKTLLSLSTAAIVLSVGLAQFLVGRGDEFAATRMLPFSWGGFLIAIVAATGRIIQSGAANSLRIGVERERYDLRLKLHDATEENAVAVYEQALDDARGRAWDNTERGIASYNRIGLLMIAGFLAGMFCLLAFASSNLPL